MKKYLFVLLGLLLLTGCAEEKAKDPVDTTPEVEVDTTEPTDDVTEDDVTEDDVTEEDGTEVEKEQVGDLGDDLTTLEEYAIIDDNIDLSKLKATVEEDNPGNRIILFEDGTGKKVYKSVYVKNDQHLKIIKLDDEGLLYNDFIK